MKGRGPRIWLLMRKREKKVHPERGRDAESPVMESRDGWEALSECILASATQLIPNPVPRMPAWSKGRKMLKAKPERTVSLNSWEIVQDRPHGFGIPITEYNMHRGKRCWSFPLSHHCACSVIRVPQDMSGNAPCKSMAATITPG